MIKKIGKQPSLKLKSAHCVRYSLDVPDQIQTVVQDLIWQGNLDRIAFVLHSDFRGRCAQVSGAS